MIFVQHALEQSHEVGIHGQLVLVVFLHVEAHVAGKVLLNRDQVLDIHVVQEHFLRYCAEHWLANKLLPSDCPIFKSERHLLLQRAANHY